MIVKVEGYSPEGLKITLEATVLNMKEAMQFTGAAAKSGVTAEPPDLGARKQETIASVIRREKINDDGSVTPIIDMYPAWGRKDYGQYRFVGHYLNSDDDIRQFEEHSGLKVRDLPLFDSQTPWKRHPKQTRAQEVRCRPFIAIKQFVEEKVIDGKTEKVFKFVGYGDVPAPAPAPAATPSKPMPPALGDRAPLQMPPPGHVRPAAAPSPSPAAPLARR